MQLSNASNKHKKKSVIGVVVDCLDFMKAFYYEGK